jgi:hypothetical protein
MNTNPQLMTAVEQLGYRVTSGDVATHTGIHLEATRSGLLALAERTGGHLQVTDTGEVIYVLSPDFRQVLLRKSIKLQVRAWLDRVWKIGFYLVKISFGILLITSISAVYLTILALTLAAIFSSEGGGDCGDCGDGGGSCVLGIFDWGSSSSSNSTAMTTAANSNIDRSSDYAPIRAKTQRQPLNFLEAVFSVLFGDGNPNADLEQRRWSYIGNLIHRQHGVAIAEQIAPFLDDVGQGYEREYENYMLPVLTKFNGIPEVSPTGQLVYHFPELQTTLKDDPDRFTRVPISLRERKWKFSKATPTQTNWSIALFGANLVGIGILAAMLRGISSSLISGTMVVLALYGIGLVVIPACRYFWVKYQDRQVRKRNQLRRQQVNLLQQGEVIKEKLDYAKQFAKQYKITDRDIIYTTEEDALAQEFKRLE